MARVIGEVLRLQTVQGRFLVYFAGCKMAGTAKDETTFQEALFRELVRNVDQHKQVNVEVVAHSYGTDQGSGSFNKPSTLDVFAVKGRVGQFFQRYSLMFSKWIGGYSPTFANALTVLVPGALAVLFFPEYRQEAVALGFVTMGISRVLSSSAEKLGKSLQSTGARSGFVFNLLREHLTCENKLTQERESPGS